MWTQSQSHAVRNLPLFPPQTHNNDTHTQTLSALLTAFCVTELVFCLLPVLHHVDLAFLPEVAKVCDSQ